MMQPRTSFALLELNSWALLSTINSQSGSADTHSHKPAVLSFRLRRSACRPQGLVRGIEQHMKPHRAQFFFFVVARLSAFCFLLIF
jgi:hypothetical protein